MKETRIKDVRNRSNPRKWGRSGHRGRNQHDRPVRVTLADTICEDLISIAEHIEVSQGGLERFLDVVDEALKRTAAITALLDAPRPVAMRESEAALTEASTYCAEHPTYLRKDRREAAFFGGTDLGYH